jgi:hypothetical protein
MDLLRYDGLCEWTSPTRSFGICVGWREMLLGVSVTMWNDVVYLEAGIGPVVVWVRIRG